MSGVAQVAVLVGANAPMELRTVPVPEPGPGEILVRITCCTICGSDLHTWRGRRSSPIPGVLGHEIVGRIVACGPGAPERDLRGLPLREGDRITWTLTASCGSCFFCTHYLPQKCERLFKYGHEPFSSARQLNGGFADHCLLVPGTGLLRLPDSLEDTLAAPANCATATVCAALRAAGSVEGAVVLVLGAGALGLSAAAVARQSGAEAVVVCDLDSSRRSRATAFGATDFATPSDLHERLVELTAGRGADVALEFAGSAAAVQSAISGVRVGGTVIVAGTALPTPAIPLEPERVLRRMLTIRGQHNYTPVDLLAAVEFLNAAQHRFPLAEMVTHRFSLTGIDEAIRQAEGNPGGRVALVMDEPGR